MIKIERTEVFGWEAAIRGMRNPMNSWDKSDSGWQKNDDENGGEYLDYIIGLNDLKLMQNLVKAGSDHAKFMRYINVTCDIEAPLYWWKEYDTYKVGTVANSCSTMHKIHERDLTINDFSHELLTPSGRGVLDIVIDNINYSREKYLETKDRKYWHNMIQLLPTSFNQRRTVQLNYAVLRNMYHARKNHKLNEWHGFCDWVETLPYAKELIVSAD